MSRNAEQAQRDDQLEQLKRLLLSKQHANGESLEDAVDQLLWGELDRRQEQEALDQQALDREPAKLRDLARTHPK